MSRNSFHCENSKFIPRISSTQSVPRGGWCVINCNITDAQLAGKVVPIRVSSKGNKLEVVAEKMNRRTTLPKLLGCPAIEHNRSAGQTVACRFFSRSVE